MDKRIKVGVWGLGRAGMNMHGGEMAQFPEQYCIHSGMDLEPERNAIFAQRYGAKTYDDAQAFLNDPEVELIAIATRSADHVLHTQQALEAGKYVFLEKPIALNYPDALKILELSKAYPGKIFLRHNRRFEAPFNHIKELLASGVLGEVYEIKLCRHSYQRRYDWQTIIACGGGQLNNWGPHIIDHALQFLDYQVADIWSDLKKVASLGDAEDHLKILLRGESGCVVDLEISGGVALPQPQYTIFGTRGALTCEGHTIHLKYIDPDQVFTTTTADPGNPPLEGGVSRGYAEQEAINWVDKTIPVSPSVPTDMHHIWQALYQAIREGVPYPITVEQGVAVVKVTDEVKRHTTFKS